MTGEIGVSLCFFPQFEAVLVKIPSVSIHTSWFCRVENALSFASSVTFHVFYTAGKLKHRKRKAHLTANSLFLKQ